MFKAGLKATKDLLWENRMHTSQRGEAAVVRRCELSTHHPLLISRDPAAVGVEEYEAHPAGFH